MRSISRIHYAIPHMGRSLRQLSTNTNAIQLYGFPLSQPTRAIIFLCEENGISYNLHHYDARKGDTRKPEFKKLFPTMMVPAIIDPSVAGPQPFKLEESAAILQYICEKHQLAKWYPLNDIHAKAHVNFWLHWHHSNTRKSTRSVLVPFFFPPKNMPIEDVLNQGRREYSRVVQFLETHLNSHPNNRFLCSNDHPTIADLLILPELDQIGDKGFNLFDYSPFPKVTNYMNTVAAALKTYPQNFDAVVREATAYKAKVAQQKK
jgi:glutathione S-transferase